MDGLLKCSRCKKHKRETAFGWYFRTGAQIASRSGYCLPCRSSYDREYRTQNSAKRRAQSRRYRESNREKMLAYLREYYRKNKARLLEECRQYRISHRAEHNAQKRKYRRAIPDKVRLWNENWRKRSGYKTSRETIQVCAQRRRALLAKAGGRGITKADVRRMYVEQKGRCFWCGKRDDKMEIDHVVPLSRGGRHDPDNTVMACKICNCKKHNKLPDEWKNRRAS